ncbi:MAG: ferritin-like domain-containing protein [Candidatus Eisenbacteria bacterium]
MSEYQEPWHALPEAVRDAHRALTSLKEEIEAIDWYHQRVPLAGDADLKASLAHNRDEEVEHACMMLEWLRRNMPAWDEALRTFLFTEGPLTEIEEKVRAAESGAKTTGTLAIGDLKEGK